MTKRTGQDSTNHTEAVLPPPHFRGIPGLRADWRHIARMFLLEAIQQAVATKEHYEGASWTRVCQTLYRNVPDKEQSDAQLISMLRAIQDAQHDVASNARRRFAEDFPEVAERLHDKDYQVACDVWRQKSGKPKADENRIPKWECLSELMEDAGLGKVSPKSLEKRWGEWIKRRNPPA